MRLLRMSCRCHRLQAGVARLGADLVHHSLLEGLPWLLPSPLHFRTLQDWLDLVRQGVLDGALVSQLELDREPRLQVPDLELHRLGRLPLALARAATPGSSTAARSIEVLVPTAAVATGLRTLLRHQGWMLRSVGPGFTTHEQWRDQLHRRGCAMPVGGGSDGVSSWTGDLERLPLADGSVSTVWLALPHGSDTEPLLRHTLERLRAHPALAG